MGGRNDNLIWFDRPAGRWEETHPIGNGSLGGMVWGGVDSERVGLNLDTLWSGTLRDTNNYDAINYLDEARQEIFDGKYEKACHTLEEHMLGEFGENYLPMGDLRIDFPGISGDEDPVKNYRRQLDVGTATATVSFEKNGIKHSREYFCSYPDKMMVIRLSSSEKTDFSARIESELLPGFVAEGSSILMEGRCPEHVDPSYLQSDDPIIWGERGIHFAARLSVAQTDGKVRCEGGEISVSGMTECVLTLQAKSGSREDPMSVPEIKAPGGDYSTWRERHISDYKNLFDRVRISLGDTPDLPTDRRLEALKDGAEDPEIFALFFQYGRYLLISSSREGSEAANLQGIWNWEMRAPWSSNYTTNI
ncbi:MAG: glycoside hydrolase family 95 protein, partial [Clostridiales bacterium]|nr:glycoside hydrolase family 95 protein [Clostridiales bacterium]